MPFSVPTLVSFIIGTSTVEVMSSANAQLVAIWYLNDVDGPGGETEFFFSKY